jgi:hypothetical protein
MNGTTEETDPHDNELGFIEPSEPNSQSSPPTTALSTMVSDSDNTYGFDQGGITVRTNYRSFGSANNSFKTVKEKRSCSLTAATDLLFCFVLFSLVIVVVSPLTD